MGCVHGSEVTSGQDLLARAGPQDPLESQPGRREDGALPRVRNTPGHVRPGGLPGWSHLPGDSAQEASRAVVTLRTPIPQQLDTSLPGSSPSSHGGSIHSTLTGHSTLSGHTTPVLGEPSVVPRRFPRIHPSLPSQNASSHKMAESRPRAGWDGRERLQAQKLCAPPAWEHTHTQAQTPHTCEHPCAHTGPWPPALPQEPGVPRTPGLGTPAALPRPGRMAPGWWHPFSGVSALPRRGSRAQNVHRGLRHTPAPPAAERSQGRAARRESAVQESSGMGAGATGQDSQLTALGLGLGRRVRFGPLPISAIQALSLDEEQAAWGEGEG